ncbi:MAG: AAA family ATPase [Magnetococcus sp. DMHC-1]
MLDSLSISNFRLFRKLEIARLGRVNLFSGKNGTGKSCLLEALNIYFNNANHLLLNDLIKSRNENVLSEKNDAELSGQEVPNDPIRHLFRGHLFPDRPEDGIRMGSLENPDWLKIYTLPYMIEIVETGRLKYTPVTDRSSLDEEGRYSIYVVSDIHGEIKRFIPGEEKVGYAAPKRKLFSIRLTQYVSSQGLHYGEAAYLWDLVNLTELEKEVIHALNIIEPAISGIALIGNSEDRSGRLPVVRIEGTKERIPLKSLGDGAVRLFHIILALVNAENSVLLLDEAENGLHWSVQDKLWRIVFLLAARLNVQVFATTHSKDCIEGFHGAWQDHPESGAFFRLDAHPTLGAKCTPYALRSLGNALESRVEMR